tara:strand:+ start:87 stop:329 length:243 start_codon:yes stop_codon:yes gene_type:complete
MSQVRIDITQIVAFLESAGPEAGGTVVYDLIAELKRCYELIDELEERPRDDEVENYPEPDERTPPNTTRAGADWPSGPRM